MAAVYALSGYAVYWAALTATAAYNVAGQRSAQQVKGPGHFQQQFLDELYLITPDDVAQNPLNWRWQHYECPDCCSAIAPCGTGDELSKEVAEVIRVIRASGLPSRTN